MRYELILSAFFNQPLAILPEKAAAIAHFLTRKANGEDIPDAEVAEIVAARRHGPSAPGSVRVIPVMGVISHRAGSAPRTSATPWTAP
jgi:hypothetical protein